MQNQLAHMSRVTTMGELAASIAHEINQPLAAVVTNGNACLRWMNLAEPNLDEARATVTAIVQQGKRASDIIARIRGFMTKSPPQMSHRNQRAGSRSAQPDRSRSSAEQSGATRRVGRRRGGRGGRSSPITAGGLKPGYERRRSHLRGRGEPKGSIGHIAKRYRPGHGCRPDSGVGIDPENLDQLFNPFFTTKPHGMGMGLAISRSTIQSHGGRLWAASNPEPWRDISVHTSCPGLSPGGLNRHGGKSSGLCRG